MEKIFNDIKSMKIQGAKQIAVDSLKYLIDLCKEYGFRNFNRVADRLEKTRPTAVVLHNCLKIVKKERTIESMQNLIEYLSKTNENIHKNGCYLIKGTIMTHCHSGEALSIIKYAAKEKKIKVIATETEPKMQGIKTAEELVKAKIDTVLIVDSAEAFFMKDTDIVVVGADALRKEGLVNKIGTASLAIVAKEYKKPFYVVADTLKIDNRKSIWIEERPTNEFRYSVKGAKIKNPAFDITPWKFITKIITEKGVFTPKQIKKMIK